MTREEERRIIDSVISGNSEDFEVLVIQNQTQIYNLAFRMVGNEEDAYDLSQDAFIRAYNSLDKFRGDSKFSVWLYRLTSNICLDFLRAKRRKRTISLSQLSPGDDDNIDLEVPDERFSPEREFDKKELQKSLQSGLEELPEEQREILLLREVNGMSYQEIADELDIEAGTVKSRIFRARRKLCNILLSSGNFSELRASKEQREV